MPRRLILCLCFLIAAVAAAPGHADYVRRCVDAQGVPVYTDRSCEAVQAAPREAPPGAAAGARFTQGLTVRGCARRPEQLLEGVRGALEAHDVNHLASWYHWTGTGTGTARHLMNELEGIARRPLVAIELVYPPETGAGNGVRFSSPYPSSKEGRPGELNLTPFPAPVSPPSPAEAEPAPEGLRVQQMQGAADIAAVNTDFRLVRNAGCWWIEL